MKKTLLTFFAFSFSLLAFSQGKWTPRDTLPDSAMFQGIPGFSINGYGYAGLGEYGPYNKYFTSLWQFDASTNKWAKKANFPGSARVAPTCFVICDKAYIVCGSIKSFGTCITECWEYNSTTNTWTQKANFPGTARTYAVGFAIDSLGYVGTGANELSDFRKDFYAYHPSTNTWTRIADFGGIARSGASGFAVNGKGYVCFGQDSTIKNHNDMWEYDPVANTWTQKGNCPGPGLLIPCGFSICDNIYVGSGDSTAGFLSNDHRFWKYNTLSDSWAQESNAPGITKVEGAAFAIGDTGYFGFGADSNGYVHDIFDKFYAGDNCPIVSSCNSNAGINEVSVESGISIYPNPFNDYTHIEIPNTTFKDSKITCYDLLGREQDIKYDVSTLNNATEIKLYRGKLPNGMYLLRINNENVLSSVKILIN